MKIKLNDVSFLGDKYSSKFSEDGPFSWERGDKETGNDLVFFTDLCLGMADYPCYKDKTKVAMILEPPVINSHPYHFLLNGGFQNFQYVLTHNEEIAAKLPNGRWYPVIQHWIKKEDRKKYPKTKLINIIASSQNYAEGHVLRHSLIKRLKEQNVAIDIMGKGYSPFEFKVDALKDYKFSVVIENCRQNLYYTEKLLDVFGTYTIPLYWGPENINKQFNTEGMIICNTEDKLLEMTKLISTSGSDIYNDSRVYKAVEDNYFRDSKYESAEDWIFFNFLKKEALV